jgi:hypothetical protein
MLAARVEPKNGIQENGKATQMLKAPPGRSSSRPPALDQKAISSTTSNVSRARLSRMITIPGMHSRRKRLTHHQQQPQV